MSDIVLSINKLEYIHIVQVAALAPLALLLVLEARCAHFVIAHFNNMSNASLLPHINILYMMTNLLDVYYKDVSGHYRDCNGNGSAHVY